MAWSGVQVTVYELDQSVLQIEANALCSGLRVMTAKELMLLNCKEIKSVNPKGNQP